MIARVWSLPHLRPPMASAVAVFWRRALAGHHRYLR